MTEEQIEQIVTAKLKSEMARIRKRRLLILMLAITLVPITIWAASITKPYTFTAGSAAVASQVNDNFDALFTKVNELDTRATALETKNDYAVFQQVHSANVADGGCTAGAWYTRGLNTTQGIQGTSISRSGNQVTLNPGTYIISANAPAHAVERAKMKLRNITDNTDDLIGTSEYASSGIGVTGHLNLFGSITVTSAKTYEIQQRCSVGNASGHGFESNFGVNEVYTVVYIHRIK